MAVQRTPRTRHRRASAAVPLATACAILSLGLGLTGCGKDDPVLTSPDLTSTTTPLSTEPVELSIDEAIAKGDAALAAAGSDLCSIMDALRGIGSPAQPTTPEETKKVVEFLGRQYDRIATALAVTDLGNATKLRNLIESALRKVKESGYDPATLQSFGTDPDFLAINTIIVGKCPATS